MPPLPPDPLRLRRRLALQGGGFALLLLAAFSSSLYAGIAWQRAEDQRTELRLLAAAAASQLPLIAHESQEAAGSAKFRPDQRLLPIAGLDQQRLQWFDRRGVLLSEQGSLPLPSLPLRPVASQAAARPLWQRWPGGVSLWQPVYSHDSGGDRLLAQPLGSVRVALSDQAARLDLQRLRRGLLLGGLVTLLAALLVGRRMLMAAFAPLQQQVLALQRFTADVSHELRHPLTALRTLLAAVPPALRLEPALSWRELDGLSRRMGELVDDLLLLAREQQAGSAGPGRRQDLQAFDLLELLEDLTRCYGPQARAAGVSLRLSPSPLQHSLPVRGQAEALQRLFTNLLVNAIRHSPPGGLVSLEATATGQRLRVAVTDQGQGIPPQARERVFDRFWRGGDQGGQSGLGLAIARAIARRHGGDLHLGESRPGRCVLLVELPIVGPTS